jgi:hypothetical protein
LGLTGEAAEKEIEKRMFEHARNYNWKWRAERSSSPPGRKFGVNTSRV